MLLALPVNGSESFCASSQRARRLSSPFDSLSLSLSYHSTSHSATPSLFIPSKSRRVGAVVFVSGADGRPNGEGWCTFVSPEEAQRAIYSKNRQHLGNRYVEIFPA